MSACLGVSRSGFVSMCLCDRSVCVYVCVYVGECFCVFEGCVCMYVCAECVCLYMCVCVFECLRVCVCGVCVRVCVCVCGFNFLFNTLSELLLNQFSKSV